MPNRPSQEVSIAVTEDQAEHIFKAIEAGIKDSYSEVLNGFSAANPASKKLVSIVEEAYDTMTKSLIKEVIKLFSES